jgi:hypothetical protein
VIDNDELRSGAPERADRDYLQMLKLAADVSEDRVTEAINEVVNRGEAISLARVRELVSAASESAGGLPQVVIDATPLASYDELLQDEEVAA